MESTPGGALIRRGLLTAPAAFVVVVTATSGLAAAEPVSHGDTDIPLSSVFRNCSFAAATIVSPTGTGSGSMNVDATNGGVSARVNLATAMPNTNYSVRLIQTPRPADRTCNAGDPGVAAGALVTDGNGTGSLTLQGPRMAGAKSAWVSIDGPPRPGTVIGEFYTSELQAPL